MIGDPYITENTLLDMKLFHFGHSNTTWMTLLRANFDLNLCLTLMAARIPFADFLVLAFCSSAPPPPPSRNAIPGPGPLEADEVAGTAASLVDAAAAAVTSLRRRADEVSDFRF